MSLYMMVKLLNTERQLHAERPKGPEKQSSSLDNGSNIPTRAWWLDAGFTAANSLLKKHAEIQKKNEEAMEATDSVLAAEVCLIHMCVDSCKEKGQDEMLEDNTISLCLCPLLCLCPFHEKSTVFAIGSLAIVYKTVTVLNLALIIKGSSVFTLSFFIQG